MLKTTHVSAQTALWLPSEVPVFDPQSDAEHDLLVGRARLIDEFLHGRFARSGILGLELTHFPKGPRLLLRNYHTTILRPVRNMDLLGCIDFYSDGIETIRAGRLGPVRTGPPRHRPGLSNGHRRGFFERLHGDVAAWASDYPPVLGLFSNVDIGALSLRTNMVMEAEARIFRTALALVAHKQERGEYPKTLSDLELPRGIDPTGDPFTGVPLKYRRDGDGFVVYSVGCNRADDGGVDLPGHEGDIAERLER